MTTITQTITALPTAPDPFTMTRDEFNAAAAASVLAQKAMTPEINAWAGQANTVGGEVSANAVAAAASAVTASNAAAAAIANANATAWVSGGTYAAGDVVWSLINFLPYRNSTGTNTTTDPSADPTNWVAQVASAPQWVTKTANYTAANGDYIDCDTVTIGTFTVTAPPTPSDNDKFAVNGVFSTNKLIIDWNGSNHFGLTDAADPTTDITSDRIPYVFTFYATANEWRFGV